MSYNQVGATPALKSGTIPGLIKTTVEFGIFTGVAYFTEQGELSRFPAKDYKMLCLALVAFFFVAYWLVMRQGTTKAALNPPDVINSQEKSIVDALRNIDRSVGNMLEQMPCFLLVTLPYGMFVNPILAGYLVFAYVFLLILYPALYDMGAPLLFISTFPRYFILYYMAGAVMLAALRT
eukprot:gb/GFBE01046953.1/.p1 GENE.gb/GFBE01046953.1/~~gb/GFBE01046953.1/.p1  ORF type:complete len:179 (+),score=43.19 gb/GFBE01046953.1/:1-537(+)